MMPGPHELEVRLHFHLKYLHMTGAQNAAMTMRKPGNQRSQNCPNCSSAPTTKENPTKTIDVAIAAATEPKTTFEMLGLRGETAAASVLSRCI